MLGDNIKRIRKFKGISINKLAKLSGISLGYLSDLENNKAKNPTMEKLNKIANILGVLVEDFFREYPEPPVDDAPTANPKDDFDIVEESKTPYSPKSTEQFNTPEEAMKFILGQPTIMGFGGFDVNKMRNEDIIDFANELLNQLKLLGYKYKK